jgi:hypothetical protein
VKDFLRRFESGNRFLGKSRKLSTTSQTQKKPSRRITTWLNRARDTRNLDCENLRCIGWDTNHNRVYISVSRMNQKVSQYAMAVFLKESHAGLHPRLQYKKSGWQGCFHAEIDDHAKKILVSEEDWCLAIRVEWSTIGGVVR